MKPKIGLITLGVADLARSLAFYRDGLGLPTHEYDPKREWCSSSSKAAGWRSSRARSWQRMPGLPTTGRVSPA